MFFAFYVVKHVLENLCHVYEAYVCLELALCLDLLYNNSDCHHEPNSCSRYCFLNLTVAVWYHCWILRFVWSTRSPDVATSICAVAE